MPSLPSKFAPSYNTRLCVLFRLPLTGIVCAVMERLSLKTLCTLLLATCVAFAINVSAFQTSGMAAKITVSAEMAAMTHGGCDTCPGGDQDNAAACITACTVTIVAVLPAAMSPGTQRLADLPLPMHLTAHGKFSAPDPHPPKSRDLS